MTLAPEKIEIRKQWDENPCAAETVPDRDAGTLEFYRAIRDHRYKVYAPWLDHVARFEDWRDRDVLEIGVGLGSDHLRFAEGGNRMVALDLSREHLWQTRRHVELEELTTVPVYGDAERMAFRDDSFDLVYAFGVLHHTPDPSAAIDEIRRVLRPGGTVILSLYHRCSLFFLNFFLRHGIARGGLWQIGWRQLMSTIEARTDTNSATPLVTLYSSREVRRLLSRFRQTEVTTRHVGLSPLQSLDPSFRAAIERLLGPWGWYLIARGTK